MPIEKPKILSDELIELWEKFDSEKPILLADMIREETYAQLQHDKDTIKEIKE